MDHTDDVIRQSDALVLFGITGDLARKKIFPALYSLAKRGTLNVPVVGVATSRLSPAQLRKRVRDAIKESGKIDDKQALRHLLSLRCHLLRNHPRPAGLHVDSGGPVHLVRAAFRSSEGSVADQS